MKLPVSLQALPDYDPVRVSEALYALLEPLGGMSNFVKSGQKVLLKPNMLAGKSPEKAVTTHPEIVRQVILQVQDAGGIVSVGDSPGIGKPESVARRCGIFEVIEQTGARFAPFTESEPITLSGGTFHHLEVARDVLETEVIINLAKLKTHQMMGYTGAVKNLFGLIVGMRKVRLHLQAGTDKAFFALMLLELADRFVPALNIIDAVVAMEGDGPGSGDPFKVGAVLASPHALAIDTVATTLVGLPISSVWTQRVAIETSRPGCSLDELCLHGSPMETLQVSGFRPSKTTDVNFGLPGPLKNALKQATTARPVIDHELCRLCSDCVRHCPPEAMQVVDKRVEIDYDRCIRCFCCQELCPDGAIITRQGLLLRLNEFVHGRRK